MLKFEEAQKKILRETKRLPPKELLLIEAKGLILAENIKAEQDIPPFNKSAMDGYALSSCDLKSVPQELKCIGVVKAGRVFKRVVKRGECVKIMTGSALPKGTDSVVMVERTAKGEGKNQIKVLQSVKRGENVCFKGEDIKKGTIVLRKGMLIRAPEISIALSMGRTKVKVYRRPRVAILNTGDEIIEAGKGLTYGKIYNSTGLMLFSLLKEIGAEVKYLGIVKDKRKDLTKKIREGLKDNDILLICGGVSVGDYDLVPDVLKECGVREIFHKIRIKPGKPLFFGKKENKLVFGIPGNPVSTYLVFLVLITPAIKKMLGKSPNLNICKARLREDFRQKPGRKHFIPAQVQERKYRLDVFPVKNYHGSADIISLSQANAFMIIEEDVSFLKKNTKVEVVLW